MKTRDAPPEKKEGAKGAGVATNPEMARFRSLTKKVMSVDKDAVLKEEKKKRD